MATGSATITGTLLPPEVVEELQMHEDGESYFIINETGEPDDVQLIDGEITVVPGARTQIVAFSWGDSDWEVDVDDVHDQAEELVAAVREVGGKIEGVITLDGRFDDEDRWPWRLVFANDSVTKEFPSLVWPDGSSAR